MEVVAEQIRDLGFTFEVDSETQVQDLWGESDPQPEQKVAPTGPITLPKYFDPVTWQLDFPLLDWYLNLRGYTRDILIEYQCGVCTVGECMNRLIIPVFFKGELVSYQAADLTRRAQVKYKTAPGRVNDFLYRWDMIDVQKGPIVLVEGILDSWRLGRNSLATFGSHITDRQKNLLISVHPEKVIVARDGDAYFYSLEEAEDLQVFFPQVSTVQFSTDEDPDSYGRKFGTDALWDLVLNS
jgi:hypothetical protein